MAGRKKKRHPQNLVVSKEPPRSTAEDITLEQYTKGFQVFSSSGSLPEVLAATGMTRKQFEYLLSNPLPSSPEEHPSYYQRFSEVATEMRLHAVEAADVMAKAGVRNLKARSQLALMAEHMARILMENRTRLLVTNQQLSPDDDDWKPNHKLVFTTGERAMLKTLLQYMDTSRMADAFERIFERITTGGVRMPRNAKVALDIDPESVLPAVVTTQAAVAEAQEQEEKEFHQQLFRDFDSMSEEELEALLNAGAMPASEKFAPDKDDDLPGE